MRKGCRDSFEFSDITDDIPNTYDADEKTLKYKGQGRIVSNRHAVYQCHTPLRDPTHRFALGGGLRRGGRPRYTWQARCSLAGPYAKLPYRIGYLCWCRCLPNFAPSCTCGAYDPIANGFTCGEAGFHRIRDNESVSVGSGPYFAQTVAKEPSHACP